MGAERIESGLIIMVEPLDDIMFRCKTWEIRGTNTTKRGKIALIMSRTQRVWGTCEIIDVKGPLTLEEYNKNSNKHRGGKRDDLPYKDTYAWVIKKGSVKGLKNTVPYNNKRGPVVWVNIDTETSRNILRNETEPDINKAWLNEKKVSHGY